MAITVVDTIPAITMRRLRDKLGEAARLIDTVRGVGYRILDE